MGFEARATRSRGLFWRKSRSDRFGLQKTHGFIYFLRLLTKCLKKLLCICKHNRNNIYCTVYMWTVISDISSTVFKIIKNLCSLKSAPGKKNGWEPELEPPQKLDGSEALFLTHFNYATYLCSLEFPWFLSAGPGCGDQRWGIYLSTYLSGISIIWHRNTIFISIS